MDNEQSNQVQKKFVQLIIKTKRIQWKSLANLCSDFAKGSLYGKDNTFLKRDKLREFVVHFVAYQFTSCLCSPFQDQLD